MIKTIIVDDEKHARENLKERLSINYSKDIQIIDEASSVSDAIEKINLHQPDLVFLDIDILGGSGFDIIEQLQDVNFKIIFVTGFDNHAIKAIKIGALDYILKPIDDDEFSQAVDKAISVTIPKNPSINESIDIANDYYQNSKQDKIILKTLEAHHVVYLKDIMYCKSDGNYTTFHLVDEKIMISKPLKQVEILLDKKVFLRCHQSYMVNTSFVTKYTSEGNLILKNETELPVASRRKEIVLKRIF